MENDVQSKAKPHKGRKCIEKLSSDDYGCQKQKVGGLLEDLHEEFETNNSEET